MRKIYSSDFHPHVQEAVCVWNTLRNMGFASDSLKFWLSKADLGVRVLITLDKETSFSIEVGTVDSIKELISLKDEWFNAINAWNNDKIVDFKTMLANSVIYQQQKELVVKLKEANFPTCGPEVAN